MLYPLSYSGNDVPLYTACSPTPPMRTKRAGLVRTNVFSPSKSSFPQIRTIQWQIAQDNPTAQGQRRTVHSKPTYEFKYSEGMPEDMSEDMSGIQQYGKAGNDDRERYGEITTCGEQNRHQKAG
ncbi:hypothetical protein [Bifidobacterium olomucense]|uniref:hypothetical protein n=1 Tax=Bifidobacterium olomucense TaxID=2675324 RepID=UPI00145F0015|nr:hypothetical protein [Bifidobacterium sp. DSM 109959]